MCLNSDVLVMGILCVCACRYGHRPRKKAWSKSPQVSMVVVPSGRDARPTAKFADAPGMPRLDTPCVRCFMYE